MSYSNETVHYGIPLPQQTDLVNGLDWNTSSEKVDGALYDATQIANTLKSDMEEVKEDIVDLKAEDVKIETSATELTARVSTLEQNIATDEEDIQDAFDMITDKEVTQAQSDVHVDEKEWFRYNGVLYVATKEINVGDTIVPNENCRATNIEDEMSDGGSPFDPTEINQKIEGTQQMIANVEVTGDTFTSDMTSGTWFRHDNDLYILTTDVKSGDSITVDTNCRIATVEDNVKLVESHLQSTAIKSVNLGVTPMNGHAINAQECRYNPLMPFVRNIFYRSYIMDGYSTKVKDGSVLFTVTDTENIPSTDQHLSCNILSASTRLAAQARLKSNGECVLESDVSESDTTDIQVFGVYLL